MTQSSDHHANKNNHSLAFGAIRETANGISLQDFSNILAHMYRMLVLNMVNF